MDGETRLYSLFGQPVSHSLSPLMFNKTFEKLGLNRAYMAFDVSPERLGSAVDAAKSLSFEGFNVTMPHKAAILPLLDKIANGAREIGAVNTVVVNQSELTGHNTDGEGALKALRAHGYEPKGKRIVVIGAGGAARAIGHSLAVEADEITILDRTPSKARALADRTRGTAKTLHGPLSRSELEQSVHGVSLVINATPVQTPLLFKTLGLQHNVLPKDTWIFDLAYDKRDMGRASNKQIHPLEMLVQQAALSYELWLGQPTPLELMRSILVEHNKGEWI